MSAHAMAAAGKARRKAKHEEHEEHENHERWLITYADMITLLMVLFIVLFAIGQTDLAKYRQLQEGLAESFGNDSFALETGSGLLSSPGDGLSEAALAAANEATDARDSARQAIAEDRATLEATREAIEQQLSESGVEAEVGLRVENRGLIVTILTDSVLFAPGSDAITAAGADLLGPIAQSLAGLPNDVSVEGHTDDRPISTARFASNWELSTARATQVLRLLQTAGPIAAGRLSAAGYADTHPIADNATDEGRAANRRVEIVVHSLVDEAALVAQVAGTDAPPTSIDAIGDPIPEASHGQQQG